MERSGRLHDLVEEGTQVKIKVGDLVRIVMPINIDMGIGVVTAVIETGHDSVDHFYTVLTEGEICICDLPWLEVISEASHAPLTSS